MVNINTKTKKQLIKAGLDAINKQLNSKVSETKEIDFLGKKFCVLGNVWSPEHSSTMFMAQNLGNLNGKTMIEMGCGSGALSVIACVKGAKKVYSFDINKNAVKCTRLNAKKNHFENKIKMFYSNLFEKTPKIKVDLILFNAPFTNVAYDTHSMLKYAVFDKNHDTIDRFLFQAKNFLKASGKIRIMFSLSAGNVNIFNKICKKNNFSKKIIIERKKENKHHRIYDLTYKGKAEK